MNGKTALLVIDMQNDFCEGGALAVDGATSILSVVNSLIAGHDHVILTQDWHPAGHSSFASEHQGKSPFETVAMPYGEQTLWPDHCLQGSQGAEFHPSLKWTKAEMIVRKGFRPEIDSYSAFRENDRQTPTGLAGYLRERQIANLVLCGLAFDYCVAWSALDARRFGFSARVVEQATAAIDLDGSKGRMRQAMEEAGVTFA
ncbi:bifunctional nicotinamidase/pyrazinamidase [Notoacmeibacter sp. MSK16QG-6]|uniref:bifunctional nicotinamidase/pyrazinamidase n=1 Tax=Notoacmeibacter sp. MSK16QG-6 TaxID=2957982 RepID=UPI00209CD010|nr:bifunctional nicotinamidase/pyrazinamidase [Notoacmeibacter sp. MSK16QG-6]MCP1198827.1 bifunctional nicotinamidase/pyrazinamidase [Notoacmeibacter sp. MSK16QG-6]